MRLSAILFASMFFPFALAGCWSSGSENINTTNSMAAGNDVVEYADANTALAEGTRFLDADEIDKAISALNQAVRLNPDLAEAYFKLGIAYALVETRDTLNLEATPDTASDPDDTKATPKKANSVIAFEKATEAYKKLIDAEPENHEAHFNLGLAYNKLNEDENAAKALKEAVKLNPEDSLYQTELGAILIKLAQYREAIPPLKKALELDPDNIEAQELLEDAEAGRKRIDYRSTPKPASTPSGEAGDDPQSASPTPSPAPAASPAKSPQPKRSPTPGN